MKSFPLRGLDEELDATLKKVSKKTNLLEIPQEIVKTKQPKIYDTKCDSLGF